jgi:hypothetical protein
MKTSIRGKPSAWPQGVHSRFECLVGSRLNEGEVVTSANYFTPRPRIDEWNHPTYTAGFVYTLNGRRVCIVEWVPERAK